MFQILDMVSKFSLQWHDFFVSEEFRPLENVFQWSLLAVLATTTLLSKAGSHWAFLTYVHAIVAVHVVWTARCYFGSDHVRQLLPLQYIRIFCVAIFLCRLFIARDAKPIFIYHIKEADGPRGQVDQPNQAAGPVKLMTDK